MGRLFRIAVVGILLIGILNGCAVSGYNLGKHTDKKAGHFEPTYDIEEIKVHDGVRVHFQDESSVLGIVERVTADSMYLHVHESLTASEFYNRINGEQPLGTSSGFKLDSFQSIEKIHFGHGGRILGTTFGGILDMGIAIAAIVTAFLLTFSGGRVF
jgi:hypothetical protein